MIEVLFSTFVLLWITSFVNSGVLSSEEEAKEVIQNANIVCVLFSLVFFKLAGLLTDKFPAYINLPISFLLRASACVTFIFIKDPRSFLPYFTLGLFVVGNLFENVTLNGLFNKHLAKDVRGTLTGAY